MACFDAKPVATFDYNVLQTQRNLHLLFTVVVILEFGSLAVAVATRNNHYCFSPRERKFASLAPLKASAHLAFPAQCSNLHLLDHRSMFRRLTRRLLHLDQLDSTFMLQTCPMDKTKMSLVRASLELWLSWGWAATTQAYTFV